jgi:hypothetical protein
MKHETYEPTKRPEASALLAMLEGFALGKKQRRHKAKSKAAYNKFAAAR